MIARAVVFRDERVLLVRRAPDQRIAPGVWQCPAGKQDPGETIDETLARELFEETALTVLSATPLGTTSTELETDGQPTVWHQHSFLVDADGGEVRLSHEHDLYRWVPVDEIDELVDLSPQVRQAIGRALEERARRAGT